MLYVNCISVQLGEKKNCRKSFFKLGQIEINKYNQSF